MQEEGMKVARQSERNYWINFGKRAAHAGKTLEWVSAPVASEPIKEWLREGYEAQTKKMARKAKKEACHDNG
jgi:hypothetical protein